MIQEIHKGCGGTIGHLVLTSYPPIHVRKCDKCVKEMSRDREKIDRVEVE